MGKLAREEATSAFASYVLGYVGVEDGDGDVATKHFDNAYRLDKSLLDAGRQLRSSASGPRSRRPSRFASPRGKRRLHAAARSSFSASSPSSPQARSATSRRARAGMFSDYVEVR